MSHFWQKWPFLVKTGYFCHFSPILVILGGFGRFGNGSAAPFPPLCSLRPRQPTGWVPEVPQAAALAYASVAAGLHAAPSTRTHTVRASRWIASRVARARDRQIMVVSKPVAWKTDSNWEFHTPVCDFVAGTPPAATPAQIRTLRKRIPSRKPAKPAQRKVKFVQRSLADFWTKLDVIALKRISLARKASDLTANSASCR